MMFHRSENWNAASVASCLRIARRDLDAIGNDDETGIHGVFVRLHRNHFGNRPQDTDYRSAQADSAFRWVEMHCARNGIDLETWITSQMHSMILLIRGNRETNTAPTDFLPRMMTGDRAKERYHAFLRNGYRYHGRIGREAFSREQDRSRFLSRVVAEDTIIREQQVVAMYHGAKWEDVSTTYGIEEWSWEWRVVNGMAGIKAKVDLDHRYGAGFVTALVNTVRLNSLNEVCTLFEYELGERLIPQTQEWTFEGFATWAREHIKIGTERPVTSARLQDVLAYHDHVVTDMDHDDDDGEVDAD